MVQTHLRCVTYENYNVYNNWTNPNLCIRRYVGNIEKLKMRDVIKRYSQTHDAGYSYLGLINASISAII